MRTHLSLVAIASLFAVSAGCELFESDEGAADPWGNPDSGTPTVDPDTDLETGDPSVGGPGQGQSNTRARCCDPVSLIGDTYIDTVVELNGSGSRDLDGDPLTYQWEFGAKPPGSSANFASDSQAIVSAYIDMPGRVPRPAHRRRRQGHRRRRAALHRHRRQTPRPAPMPASTSASTSARRPSSPAPAPPTPDDDELEYRWRVETRPPRLPGRHHRVQQFRPRRLAVASSATTRASSRSRSASTTESSRASPTWSGVTCVDPNSGQGSGGSSSSDDCLDCAEDTQVAVSQAFTAGDLAGSARPAAPPRLPRRRSPPPRGRARVEARAQPSGTPGSTRGHPAMGCPRCFLTGPWRARASRPTPRPRGAPRRDPRSRSPSAPTSRHRRRAGKAVSSTVFASHHVPATSEPAPPSSRSSSKQSERMSGSGQYLGAGALGEAAVGRRVLGAPAGGRGVLADGHAGGRELHGRIVRGDDRLGALEIVEGVEEDAARAVGRDLDREELLPLEVGDLISVFICVAGRQVREAVGLGRRSATPAGARPRRTPAGAAASRRASRAGPVPSSASYRQERSWSSNWKPK